MLTEARGAAARLVVACDAGRFEEAAEQCGHSFKDLAHFLSDGICQEDPPGTDVAGAVCGISLGIPSTFSLGEEVCRDPQWGLSVGTLVP